MLTVVGKITKTATLILMLSAGVLLLVGVTATSSTLQEAVMVRRTTSHGY